MKASSSNRQKAKHFQFALWTGVVALAVLPFVSHDLVGSLTPSTAQGAALPMLEAKHQAASVKTVSSKSSTGSGFKRFKPASPTFLTTGPSATKPDVHKGIYLTVGSITRTKFLDDAIDTIAKTTNPSIVFDVKGSRVFFQSKDSIIGREKGIVTDSYDLKAILDKMHAKGIYTIARVISLKDDGLYKTAPEARIKHPKTGQDLSPGWVDATSPVTLEYNRQVICEMARAGINEINLDYIRMSTAFIGDLRVFTGAEKSDRVEVFVKMVRDTINECNPQTKLGISTYAILGWNYEVNLESLGQDVKRFAPYVDIISPMAYPATFAEGAYYSPGKDPGPRNYFLVYRTLTGYAKFLGEEHAYKLRPWIQGYSVGTKDVYDQVRAVYDSGSCGFQVWNANNNYAATYGALKALPPTPEKCL